MLRDRSLITGRGLQNGKGGGGQVKFGKSFSHAEGAGGAQKVLG